MDFNSSDYWHKFDETGFMQYWNFYLEKFILQLPVHANDDCGLISSRAERRIRQEHWAGTNEKCEVEVRYKMQFPVFRNYSLLCHREMDPETYVKSERCDRERREWGEYADHIEERRGEMILERTQELAEQNWEYVMEELLEVAEDLDDPDTGDGKALLGIVKSY